MTVPTVAVINESTILSDADVALGAAALQAQVHLDFAPAWGAGANVKPYAPGQAPAKAWQLVVLDDSDQAGALGYHDLTNDGHPLAKVFAKTDQQYGYDWHVTASHELLEMLADPWIDRCVQVATNEFFAYEVADAPEDDSYGYTITVQQQQVKVSDFVYPAWFRRGAAGPYDKAGHISKPLQILPGGYIGAWTPSGGWTQITHPASKTVTASRRLALRKRKHDQGVALEKSCR